MSNVNYLAQFAKSFNWAGFFLPKNVYQDCSKLYAFCRVLDDLVDEKTNLELREERFNEIKNIYKKTYEIDNNDRKILNQNEHVLIVNDVIDLAYNNNIKRIILDDLVEGVGSDLKTKVYLRSVKDLLVYSYRVAGTVGLMMAKILSVSDTRSLKGAIDLGIAMQLTNIARDVIEDFYLTPDYFEKELNTKYGSGFSIQPKFSQSAYFRFHNKSEIYDGLYFVGAGTHPGAGVPGVLSSAKVLDKII